MEARTLVIYTFHEKNNNVDFFVKNALYADPNVSWMFVINHPTLTVELPSSMTNNIHIINRENIGHDFGAWGIGLSSIDTDQYDKYILINSSVRGPFYPKWSQERKWILSLTRLLTGDIHLAGTSIGYWNGQPHVQSMVLCFDKIGLEIAFEQDIFTSNPIHMERIDVCMNKEVGFSKAIIEAGYNIGCLLSAFDGWDFRKEKDTFNQLITYFDQQYFGMTIHPYEVLFAKIPADASLGSESRLIAEKYTSWQRIPELLAMGQEITSKQNWVSFPFPDEWDYRTYLALNPDVHTKYGFNMASARKHWVTSGIREKRRYRHRGADPNLFDGEGYLRRNPDLGSMTETSDLWCHYVRHGYLEGRKYSDKSRLPVSGYYLVDLNPQLFCGLVNQLYGLFHAIVIGNLVRRNIVVSGFYPNYNDSETISISTVLNLPTMNLTLKKLFGIQIYDISDPIFDQPNLQEDGWVLAKVPGITLTSYVESMSSGYLEKMVADLSADTEPYCNLGFCFSTRAFRYAPSTNVRKMLADASQSIVFHQDILEKLREWQHDLKLQPQDYVAVHFRLEDDMLNHLFKKPDEREQYAKQLLNIYKNLLEPYKDRQIFLATGLVKNPNSYNWVPEKLKEEFPGITLRLHDKENGREINAIIDLLLCLEATDFIGYSRSTFSELISDRFAATNKYSLLIQAGLP